MNYDDLLTRLDHALQAFRGRRDRGAAARALPRRARRRVPGHRPDPVADRAARVRRRGHDARAHRRPETGDLRLPRRRRLRVPRSRRGSRRRRARWTSTGAATRRWSTPTTRCSATRSSATRGSCTGGCERRRATSRRGCRARPRRAALRVRVVHREDPSVATTYNGFAAADSARAHIAEDLASDVVALLDSGASIEDRADDGTVCDRRTVSPGDVAVLVRRNADAELVRDALGARRRAGGARGRRQRVRHAGGDRVAAPARGARAPDVGRARRGRRADVVPRVERGRGRHGERRALGGAARPAAPVGARAAHARGRGAGRDDHALRARPGARARHPRRRAAPHRPAPHRRAAARRGDGGAARDHRADDVAAPPDRRRGRRARHRGAQPPARVRRRGGAGADDPPQQGARVPDRVPAVPVAPVAGDADRRAGELPRPGFRGCAEGRRRARGSRRIARTGRARSPSSAGRTCG